MQISETTWLCVSDADTVLCMKWHDEQRAGSGETLDALAKSDGETIYLSDISVESLWLEWDFGVRSIGQSAK